MRLPRRNARRSADRPLDLAAHRRDRRRFRVVAVLAVAVAITGLVASCSSDDDSSSSTTAAPDVTLSDATEGGETGDGIVPATTRPPVEPGTAEEYSAALLTSLTDDPDNAGLMDATEAACVAPKWVESITPERFGAAGFAPDDLVAQRSMSAIVDLGLSVEEAQGLVTALGGCGVDVRARWLESAMGEENSIVTEESRSCLEEQLTSEVIDRMTAVGLSGDSEDPVAEQANAEFLAVLKECGLYG